MKPRAAMFASLVLVIAGISYIPRLTPPPEEAEFLWLPVGTPPVMAKALKSNHRIMALPLEQRREVAANAVKRFNRRPRR